MSDGEKLRARIDEIIRESAEGQAEAYQKYGGLLDRLARQDIQSVEFAREAVDLYMDAVGKVAASGVTLLGETFTAGIKEVGRAASVAADAAGSAGKQPAKRAARTRRGGVAPV